MTVKDKFIRATIRRVWITPASRVAPRPTQQVETTPIQELDSRHRLTVDTNKRQPRAKCSLGTVALPMIDRGTRSHVTAAQGRICLRERKPWRASGSKNNNICAGKS